MGLCASADKSTATKRSNAYASGQNDAKVDSSIDKVDVHPSVLHSDIVYDVVTTSTPGETVSCGVDQTVVHYDWHKKQVLHRWKEPKTVSKLVYAPRCNSVFTASRDHCVRQWRLDEGKVEQPQQIFKGATLPLADVAVNQDSSVVCAGGRDYHMRFWDVSTAQELASRLDGQMNVITALKWIVDASLVVQTSEDLSLRIWDARTYKVEQKFSTDKYFPLGCDVHPDGLTIATAHTGFDSDGCYIKTWDRRMGRELSVFTGHTQSVYDCSYLNDEQSGALLLLSASKDQTVKVWDTKSNTCLNTASAKSAAEFRCVTAVKEPGSGRRVVAGCGDGVLYSWRLQDEGQLIPCAQSMS